MTIESFLAWLQDTDIATAISEGETLFPWIECVHVLAITFVIGSISAVDLRLLGWSSMNRPVSRLTAEILPWTWAAFAAAAISGSLMFISKAVQYGSNLSFRLKLVLLVLAGLNMVLFHLVTARSLGRWDTAPRTPWAAKLSGGTSLLLWIAIVACGRVIGFTTVALTPG
jgi:hypothetical protein